MRYDDVGSFLTNFKSKMST